MSIATSGSPVLLHMRGSAFIIAPIARDLSTTSTLTPSSSSSLRWKDPTATRHVGAFLERLPELLLEPVVCRDLEERPRREAREGYRVYLPLSRLSPWISWTTAFSSALCNEPDGPKDHRSFRLRGRSSNGSQAFRRRLDPRNR